MKPLHVYRLTLIGCAAAFFVVACVFVSCQKEPVSNKLQKTPVTDSAISIMGGVDTGSKTLGASIVNAMFADTITGISFQNAAPVVLSNVHDTTINDIATTSMLLFNCTNVTIRNCKIGPNDRFGIALQVCTNISIDSCYLYNVSTGVYAQDSKTISVTNCQAKNMMGPFPEGQFVQFNNVSGAGNRISFNKFENVLGQSYPEDAISLYASNGLPTDLIVVEGNWLRGGGPSPSGGGIMLGDGGGSFQVAKNNLLVDPGHYGMAVSGGSNMSIVNNTIYAKQQSFTTEGIYYRNYTQVPSTNIYIGKNIVNYTNSKGTLCNTYLGPQDAAPAGWNTNRYSAVVTANILPANVVSGLIFKTWANDF